MLRTILNLPGIGAIAICGAFFIPHGALAVPQCDQRDSVVDILKQKYGEDPVSIGVTSNGGLVEVFSTKDGSTWSIIVTTPQGMSCLVAAGEGWRDAPHAPPADPAI